MNVPIQHSIVMRRQGDAFAHRTVKASIVNSACQIHTDGNIKKDVNNAIVITLARLASRAICIVASAYAVKGLLGANAIDVPPAISAIRIVNAAIAIVMDQLPPIIPNRLRAMTTANVHVKLS